MQLAAVGTAALLPHDREMPSLLGRFGKVLGKIEEGVEEPVLNIKTVVAELRLAGRERKARKSGRQKPSRDTKSERMTQSTSRQH